MTSFHYRARDGEGRLVTDLVTAENDRFDTLQPRPAIAWLSPGLKLL